MSFQAYLKHRLAHDAEFRDAYDEASREDAFSWALIRARIDARVTQEQLAACIGTKQPAIARLEAGDRQPTVPMIQKLAAALNVSFEFLPSGEVLVHPAPAAQADGTPDVTEAVETVVSAT